MRILPILGGMIYLIYSIINKDKLNLYNKRRDIKDINSYIKYQLYIAIVASIISIILGIIIILFELSISYIYISPLIIVWSNYLIPLFVKLEIKN